MKPTITRTALLVVGLALRGGGCAGPTVDDEVASERPAEPRKKPIAGLVNPRFETDDAMLAASL